MGKVENVEYMGTGVMDDLQIRCGCEESRL